MRESVERVAEALIAVVKVVDVAAYPTLFDLIIS